MGLDAETGQDAPIIPSAVLDMDYYMGGGEMSSESWSNDFGYVCTQDD